jgi:hypothetical protein
MLRPGDSSYFFRSNTVTSLSHVLHSPVARRDAGTMLGGMSLGSDEAEAVPVEAGRDRISALPNEIIHLILGLLPAPEAVRTSVLAGGWRHHWKSMRSLSFAIRSGHPVLSYDWLNRFMACLLRDLRAPLDECFIYVEDGPCDDVGGLDAYRWVRQAVSKHHARELSVDLETQFKIPSFELGGKPLVSGRLARLELCNVVLSGRVLDFSRCSVLEDLDLYKCVILTGNISSQTLKRLRMDCCDFYRDESSRTCISAPNLVTLKLEHLVGDDYSEVRNMPMLEKAVVNLECMHGYDSDGFPACHKNGECCSFCEGCIGSESHSFGCCMLLHGLSSAAHLELSVPFAKVNIPSELILFLRTLIILLCFTQ